MSCERKISDKEVEEKIFHDAFTEIVNSTFIDKRIYTRIPNKDQINDPNFIAEIKAIERDIFDIVIVIGERFSDIKDIKSKRFIFKDINELPKSESFKNWERKYKKFGGAMSFSKITLGKTKESGSLDVSYYCGEKCGLGTKVHLKKINGKWKVIKTEGTWIS